MSITGQTAGTHPLTGVANLPNVTVAFPGEHWSDRVLVGSAGIVPGEPVVPVNSGGILGVQKAAHADVVTQLAIALRPVDIPDPNSEAFYAGSHALGPNEIRNLALAQGDYVHCYYSGVFLLTLVDPNHTYHPSDLIGWDAEGVKPTGKGGTPGAWAPNANADITSVFECQEVRTVGSAGEVILRVRSLRGQF